MDMYTQPVRRVLGLQCAGFIFITMLLLHLISPTESFGRDLLLPPPPFGFLFTQPKIKIELHARQEIRQKEDRRTPVAKARMARLRAAEAVECGDFRRARKILAQAQRDLRQAELDLQYRRAERRERREKRRHQEEKYVYYGYNGRGGGHF